MSESVSRGVARVAVGGCGAMLKSSAKAAHQAVTDMVNDMSEASQRDYEYLLSVAPQSASSDVLNAVEARQQVTDRMVHLKKQLAESKYKLTDKSMLPLVALSQSSLGRVVSSADWQSLAAKSGLPFGQLLDESSRQWAKNSYDYVVNSVMEVARNEGFSSLAKQKVTKHETIVSLQDSNGRAVIAELTNRPSGVTVDLDLSGFDGDGCHEAMDRILSGLESKKIMLKQSVRQKHLTLDHLKLKSFKSKIGSSKKRSVTATDERAKQSELLRRSHSSVTNRKIEGVQ